MINSVIGYVIHNSSYGIRNQITTYSTRQVIGLAIGEALFTTWLPGSRLVEKTAIPPRLIHIFK